MKVKYKSEKDMTKSPFTIIDNSNTFEVRIRFLFEWPLRYYRVEEGP